MAADCENSLMAENNSQSSRKEQVGEITSQLIKPTEHNIKVTDIKGQRN